MIRLVTSLLTRVSRILLVLTGTAVAISGCAVLGFNDIVLLPRDGRELHSLPGASRTIAIPVEFEMVNCEYTTSVKSMVLGEAVRIGRVAAGGIIKDELGVIAHKSFMEPNTTCRPAAKMSVSLIDLKLSEDLGCVGCTIAIKVEVVGCDLAGRPSHPIVYSRELKATVEPMKWTDRKTVPDAFYKSLDIIYGQLCEDWIRECLDNRICELQTYRPPRPDPKVESLEFKGIGEPRVVNGVKTYDAYHGRCSILCHDYTKAEAEWWADPQVKMGCKIKLRAEPERICVVYDDNRKMFDPVENRLVIEFDAFVRRPIIFTYVDLGGAGKIGRIIGDVRLLRERGVQEDKVQRHLEEHVQTVLRKEVKFRVWRDDKANNLVTGEFDVIGELGKNAKP